MTSHKQDYENLSPHFQLATLQLFLRDWFYICIRQQQRSISTLATDILRHNCLQLWIHSPSCCAVFFQRLYACVPMCSLAFFWVLFFKVYCFHGLPLEKNWNHSYDSFSLEVAVSVMTNKFFPQFLLCRIQLIERKTKYKWQQNR